MSKKIFLFGKNVTRSLSPYIYESWQQGLSQKLFDYELQSVNSFADVSALISRHQKDRTLLGANFTTPFKKDALLLDAIPSPVVKAIGVANTLFCKEGNWHLENTDVFGIEHSLNILCANDVPSCVIVFGSGATTQSIDYVLKQNFPHTTLYVVSRAPQELSVKGMHAWSDWKNVGAEEKVLLINATPSGHQPAELPPFFEKVVQSFPFNVQNLLFFETIYRHTSAFEMMQKKGVSVLDGWSMLCEQARKAFQLWTDVGPCSTPKRFIP